MKTLMKSLLALFLCSSIGQALGGDVVSCRLVCLEGATPPPALVVAGAKKGEEVSCAVPMGSLSQPVTCGSDGKTIRFLSAADHQLAATATLPPKIKTAILVFSPAPKNQNVPPWRVSIIDDSPKNFLEGGALLANFHTHDIRFTIGTNTLTLHPGESRSVARPTERDSFNMAIVSSQYQKGEAWVNSSETMLRFLPGMRYLMFAYLDSASGTPRIATLQDVKPSAP